MNDLCHKCGKPSHFMGDCPHQTRETQDLRPRIEDLTEGIKSHTMPREKLM